MLRYKLETVVSALMISILKHRLCNDREIKNAEFLAHLQTGKSVYWLLNFNHMSDVCAIQTSCSGLKYEQFFQMATAVEVKSLNLCSLIKWQPE